MTIPPLDSIPLELLFAIIVLLLWAALEGGYRLGVWRHAKFADEQAQPVGAMVASILGLLALLLGFTFSLAGSRFDARRQVVLEEANAIGTTYLRTRLLPQPEQDELQKLLREYVGLRIRHAGQVPIAEVISRSEALHERLWSQAQSAAAKDTGSIMTGLFIQSLNDVIDVHAKRVLVALQSRIPLSIWGGLLVLSLLGMAAVGYQAALSGTRRSPAMLGLVVAFAIVLFFIADLDRGQEGLLRVSQQALVDLQRSMQPAVP